MTSMLYIARIMTTDTPPPVVAPNPDKRSRNKRVTSLVWFIFGLLFAKAVEFLPGYSGPREIKLVVVLALTAGLGLLVLLTKRFYREDELEIFINRQALAFAVYAALLGLSGLHLLQAAGFVPKFDWSTRGVLGGLGLLVCAGILWSKRRYR
jgi:uncharacterized membrane protein